MWLQQELTVIPAVLKLWPGIRAGKYCMNDSGASLEWAWESSEEAGWRGLARPQSWRLTLGGPAMADTKTYTVGATCARLIQ